MSRTFPVLAAGVAACGLVLAASPGTAVAGEAGAEALACGDAFADLDHRDYDYSFATGEVPMRDGPHSTCAVIEVADSGQRSDYHCYVTAGDISYTYLRNVATGTQGWVDDEELTDGGSDHHC